MRVDCVLNGALSRHRALVGWLFGMTVLYGCGASQSAIVPSPHVFEGPAPDLRVTNTWLHADLHDIVLDAVQDTPIQVVLSGAAQGRLSVRVEAMPFERFLELVTAAAGVTYRRFDARTYVIVPDGQPREPRVRVTDEAPSGEVPLVTNAWFGEDVRNIVTDVMQESGLQYVLSEAIVGRLTLRVDAMPLGTFLDLVTSAVGATLKWVGPDTVYIGPKVVPREND